MSCVRHKAERVTTQVEKSYVLIRTADNDKVRLERKLIHLGLSALFSEKRGFQLPGFSLLQKICRKIFQTFFLLSNQTVSISFIVKNADLRTECGISIPLFLCFSLLGVQQKQPVIKELNYIPSIIRCTCEEGEKDGEVLLVLFLFLTILIILILIIPRQVSFACDGHW